jgi:hypothetical protein
MSNSYINAFYLLKIYIEIPPLEKAIYFYIEISPYQHNLIS